MLKLFTVLFFIVGLSSGCPASAKTIDLNPNRLVEIIDVIDFSQLGVAQKIDDLSSASKEPIDILVNSPGGSVLVGYIIVDSIRAAKAKGVKVRCTVGMLAASMAFNLLASCSERYALPSAALLFHPPRVMTREALTVPVLLKAAEDLQRIIDSTSSEIQNMLGMKDEQFQHHFNHETMWTAEQLLEASGHKWIQIVHAITGSKLVFTPDRPNPLAFLFGQARGNQLLNNKPYEIIYISEEYLEGKEGL